MKFNKTIETINNSYRTLHERASKLAGFLTKLGYSVEWGYYGQHSVMIDGEAMLEYYPIPVITVKDICDVGIDFMQVFIEGKIYAEDIEQLKLSALKKYEFSIYGVESYMQDFYFDGMSEEELRSGIIESKENEVNIAISLNGEPLTKEILDVIQLFSAIGTHIFSACTQVEDNAESNVLDTLNADTPAFKVANALLKN